MQNYVVLWRNWKKPRRLESTDRQKDEIAVADLGLKLDFLEVRRAR